MSENHTPPGRMSPDRMARDEALLWISVRIFDHLIGTIKDDEARQDEFGTFGDALRALGAGDDEITKMCRETLPVLAQVGRGKRPD